MRKYVKVLASLGLSAVALNASGYVIPEQSLNSTALSAAYVAGTSGADTSYYNPANMAFMGDKSEIEIAATYIHLTSIKYTDNLGTFAPYLNADSKKENFFIPTFHYVAPAMGDFRFGLSMIAPGGLSKRWNDVYQMVKAEEFTLKVVEINPTVSFKVNDKFAVGLGLRGVYSEGIITMEGTHPLAGAYENDMEADSIDFGYNLALTYKPIKNLILSTTYRSNVDLTVEGDATGSIANMGGAFTSDAKTQVPLPAVFSLATAYTMDETTVEFVYARTYWSAYDQLDFDFDNPAVEGVFGKVSSKDWKDVNSYRIGVTHKVNDDLKVMGGFAIDKNPVPSDKLAFELPDSDAKLYSAGLEYKLNDQMKIGLAYLYDQKEERTVNERVDSTNPATGISGTFEDAAAHLVTASFKYKF